MRPKSSSEESLHGNTPTEDRKHLRFLVFGGGARRENLSLPFPGGSKGLTKDSPTHQPGIMSTTTPPLTIMSDPRDTGHEEMTFAPVPTVTDEGFQIAV